MSISAYKASWNKKTGWEVNASPRIREFNLVLEAADALCPFELNLDALYAWLRSRSLITAANQLKLAGEAVGYFKG